jgi:hypothetical protein
MVADEIFAITGFAHLAFVCAFFPPSAGCVYYYTWILLVGVTPMLARARLGLLDASVGRTSLLATGGWLALALGLALSTWANIATFVHPMREARVRIGEVSMPADEAEEWRATLAMGHSVGAGSIAVVARTSNFALADPTLRQGRYWMMVKAMRSTPSVDELLEIVRSSDTIFVTQHDYPAIVGIPEFHSFLSSSERLHDGKYFMLLRSSGLLGRSP